MLIEVSIGEGLDKISILEIKRDKIKDKIQLQNIDKELLLLKETYTGYSVEQEYKELLSVNKKLWDVEDKLREKETKNSFDGEFTNLARSVYKLNDNRAQIKKNLNLRKGSEIVEEKSYKK